MKRIISLFLVFSILALSMPLISKERKGVDLIIQRIDGTQVRGELIALKENSLLLLERQSRADVTADIDGIRAIIIVKKSKFLKGACLGAFSGAASGVVTSFVVGDWQFGDNEFGVLEGIIAFGIGLGIVGVVIGGIFGAAAGKDKMIRIEGMPDSSIQKILGKLSKKARIRNSQ